MRAAIHRAGTRRAAAGLAVLTAATVVLPGQPSSAAVPASQGPTSSVALAADPAGFEYAVYRGEDGGVYLRTHRDGVWSGQSALGGRVAGAPAVAVAGNTVVLVARGGDDAVWSRTSTQGSWGPWQRVGGGLSAAPAVVGDAAGRVDVLARGADDALWTVGRPPGGAWSAWTRLGGVLAAGPAGVSPGTGVLEAYATVADHSVARRVRTAGVWSDWRSLGGRTYTAPAAARAPGATSTTVAVRGTNDALYLTSGAGWQSLGGALVDAPAIAAVPAGLDVAGRGTDRAVWSRRLRSGGWSAWTKAWVPAPLPAAPANRLGTDWTTIPTTSRVVALTFDAGGNAEGLSAIRATLQREHVPATFFLTGQWVRAFPDRANEVAVAGFRLGNHSETHPDFTSLTDAQVRAQLSTAEQAILRTTGGISRPLFRFPFGAVDSRVLGTVNGAGHVAVRWTVDTLGWQGTSGGQSVATVVSRVLGGARPGEIVLMHVGSNPNDGSSLDAAALPQVIAGLRARGYGFVTLDALLG